MPKTTSVSQFMGTFPHPYDREILDVGQQLIEALAVDCPLSRLRTYYIEQNAAGNSTGGTGNGTLATPWLCNTLGDLATLINTQQTGGNKAFLLKRGSVFKGNSAGPALSADGVTLAAYGDGAKPELWRSTRVTSGWTLVSGTKYSRTEATVAWVAVPTASAYISTPLARQATAGDVPTAITGTGGTFSYVSTTLTIDVGVNPNTIPLEIIYENSDSGVLVTGAGCRVNGIRSVGFGCNLTNPPNQACPFKFTASGEAACLFSNVDAFYGSTHLISQYGSGAGSRMGVANALVGWPTPSTGPTIINGYAPDGGHLLVVVGATGYGELPSGMAPTSDAALVYGHSNGTPSVLYYAQHCKPFGPTVTPFTAHLNAFGHCPPANYNPAAYRAFFVQCNRGGTYVTSEAADVCWINCTGRHVVTGSASPTVIQSGADDRGLYINDDQELYATTAAFSGTNFAVNNKATGGGATQDARRINCRVRITGTLTTQAFRWDYRTGIFSEPGNRVWRSCLMVNETGGGNLTFSGGNSATNLVGNAFYNFSLPTNAAVGYDLDAYDVTLAEAPVAAAVPANGDVLAVGVNRNDLEYDAAGRLRDPDDSTIGPYAAPLAEGWQGVVMRRRN